VKSPKTVLILLLAATTVGGAVLAWRQYAELVELRAAAMNRDERADLQKRVWDLEKLNRELQARLEAQRSPGDLEGMLVAGDGTERKSDRGSDRGGRGERGDPRGRGASFTQQANAIRDLVNKPEVQAMINLQQKAAIDARYAALFSNMNLAPEQVDRLKTLLAERSTTIQDVMSAARDQGIDPRENPAAFRKLIADAQNEINNSIKSVIGDQGFAQLTNYEQTLPQRNLVNELQQRLSYTSTPLTSTQAEQLVQILATNAPQRTASANAGGTTDQPPAGPPGGRGGPRGGGFGPPDGGRGGGDIGGIIAGALGGGPGVGMLLGAIDGGPRGGATVTPAAVTQAQTVLVPTQLAALQQIQQQQQTQQQLQQLVHDTIRASQPTPNATGGGATPPASGSAPGSAGSGAPPRKRGGG
jgi:hypothetical protein